MANDREKIALRTTKDYSMFEQSNDNRPVNLDKRKKLMLSMQEHGFLPAYPLHVNRTRSGKLLIRDGQHRFAVAQKLGLAVWYVVLDDDINIADINNTQIPWNPVDYIMSFAAQGKNDYAELNDFRVRHHLPAMSAAAILSGCQAISNIKPRFVAGEFKVKNRERAEVIGATYSALCNLNRKVRNARCLAAVYACAHVPTFDHKRLLAGAERCIDKLVSYSTNDAYLTMLEDIYNFGRKQREPLKIPAQNIMRQRNPATRGEFMQCE